MKSKYVIATGIVCVIIVVFFYFSSPKNSEQSFVVINNKKIFVELADTDEARIKGLSFRKELESDKGMLFIFGVKEEQAFWMRDMKFPLDIIWIDDNKIVNISPNLPPEGDLPKNSYFSEYPVNYVLEVNAGFCKKYNIKVGDIVYIK